jgi:type VII secretion protein EccB
VLTRRDLIHSRQFLRRRLLASFVTHQPDPLEWSGVRLPAATLVAVMVLVIAVAAVGIYGFIRPAGNKRWQSCEQIIIEAETGAPYVCGNGVLYPVANFASAALLRGVSEKPIRVSRASLTWNRGMLVGIPGAPTVLPAAKDLIGAAWSYCVRPARQPNGRPESVVLVGGQPVAGRGSAPSQLGPGEAVAVADAVTGQLFLIHGGSRHEVRDRDVVSQALGINRPDIVPVSPAWLATIPTGPPLDRLEVAGRGGSVKGLAAVKVGQIVVVQEGTQARRFVARPNGLQPLTELQEALIRATADDTSPAIASNPVQLAGVTQLEPMPNPLAGDGRLPAIVPAARSNGVVCTVTADGSDQRAVTVGGTVPTRDPAAVPAPAAPASAAGALLADEVVVPPRRGALVRSMASPSAVDGPVYLVTETGWRYAIGSATALDRLGYRNVAAVRQPSTLVERLPQGPVLSELTLAGSGP